MKNWHWPQWAVFTVLILSAFLEVSLPEATLVKPESAAEHKAWAFVDIFWWCWILSVGGFWRKQIDSKDGSANG